MNITKFLPLMLLALLAGCAAPSVNITSTPLNYQIAMPAAPSALKLSNVKFRVVTKSTIDAFIKEQVTLQGNPDPVFFVISTTDYKAISLNLAELRRYILQQQQIIVYYQKEATAINSVSLAPQHSR